MSVLVTGFALPGLTESIESRSCEGSCESYKSNAPDIFQEVMNKLLGDLNYVTVYIDDILIIQKEDESHLEKIEVVLGRLEKRGFKVNLKNPSLCRRKSSTLAIY